MENKEELSKSTKAMRIVFGIIVFIAICLGIASGIFGLQSETNNNESSAGEYFNDSKKSPF